jgi:hypothetical protein
VVDCAVAKREQRDQEESEQSQRNKERQVLERAEQEQLKQKGGVRVNVPFAAAANSPIQPSQAQKAVPGAAPAPKKRATPAKSNSTLEQIQAIEARRKARRAGANAEKEAREAEIAEFGEDFYFARLVEQYREKNAHLMQPMSRASTARARQEVSLESGATR